MAFSSVTTSRRRGRSAALSEINVTPLVDVILVLLIIFMVTAPMLQRGVDVRLPRVESAADAQEERLVVTVAREPARVPRPVRPWAPPAPRARAGPPGWRGTPPRRG